MIYIQQTLQIFQKQRSTLRRSHFQIHLVQIPNQGIFIRFHVLSPFLMIIDALVHGKEMHHYFAITKQFPMRASLCPIIVSGIHSRPQIYRIISILRTVRIVQSLGRSIMPLRHLLLRMIGTIDLLIGGDQIEEGIFMDAGVIVFVVVEATELVVDFPKVLEEEVFFGRGSVGVNEVVDSEKVEEGGSFGGGVVVVVSGPGVVEEGGGGGCHGC
mmetsp:Transcript_24638/g.50376  ORF Transcript_24638/g.50376 Transcript_24638/m.50376 type:complete len:214 (-) Transcript_24638:35-676(-)